MANGRHPRGHPTCHSQVRERHTSGGEAAPGAGPRREHDGRVDPHGAALGKRIGRAGTDTFRGLPAGGEISPLHQGPAPHARFGAGHAREGGGADSRENAARDLAIRHPGSGPSPARFRHGDPQSDRSRPGGPRSGHGIAGGVAGPGIPVPLRTGHPEPEAEEKRVTAGSSAVQEEIR